MRRLLTMAAAALFLVSCGRTTVSSNTLPPIFPDYADVTIPAQIAPMNFNLMNGAALLRQPVGQLHHRSL